MIDSLKNSLNWFYVKYILNKSSHKPPEFNEGEIWWTKTGLNVGSEIYGKGKEFTRPVLILKKYSKHMFFGIPLTTQARKGSWYKEITSNNKKQVLLLHQGRSMNYRRLKENIGRISLKVREEIKQEFANLHK